MSIRVEHSFEPVYNENSKVLILGTMPSVKSREQGFYYGHPQNRFWKVIANITAKETAGVENTAETVSTGAASMIGAPTVYAPQTIEEKRAMLLGAGIAVWDVLAACEIKGSDDNSIKNPESADIAMLLRAAPKIAKIICNGDKAYKLYLKFFAEEAERRGWPPVVKLPSTSPANAAWSLPRLTETWTAELNSCLSV